MGIRGCDQDDAYDLQQNGDFVNNACRAVTPREHVEVRRRYHAGEVLETPGSGAPPVGGIRFDPKIGQLEREVQLAVADARAKAEAAAGAAVDRARVIEEQGARPPMRDSRGGGCNPIASHRRFAGNGACAPRWLTAELK